MQPPALNWLVQRTSHWVAVPSQRKRGTHESQSISADGRRSPSPPLATAAEWQPRHCGSVQCGGETAVISGVIIGNNRAIITAIICFNERRAAPARGPTQHRPRIHGPPAAGGPENPGNQPRMSESHGPGRLAAARKAARRSRPQPRPVMAGTRSRDSARPRPRPVRDQPVRHRARRGLGAETRRCRTDALSRRPTQNRVTTRGLRRGRGEAGS